MVRASRPVVSASRLAARPVGAARSASRPHFSEDVDDGPDDGRFSCARPARDDEDLFLEALPDGLLLEGRKSQAEILFRGRDGLVEVEIRWLAGKTRELVDGPGHFFLGLVIKGKIKGGVGPELLPDDPLVAQKLIQGPLRFVRFDLEVRGALLADLGNEGEDVALLVVLFEYIKDVGLDPLDRAGVHPELEGDLVGRLEPDPPDVKAELVGVLLQDRERPVPVLPVDLRGQIRRDAVLLEEDNQAADVLMLGPGSLDLPELDRADALDVFQALRALGQDVDRPGAEPGHDPRGEHGPDAPDEPGSQEFLDPPGRCGKGQGEILDLELPAEAGIELPPALDLEHLPRGKRAGRSRRWSGCRRSRR